MKKQSNSLQGMRGDALPFDKRKRRIGLVALVFLSMLAFTLMDFGNIKKTHPAVVKKEVVATPLPKKLPADSEINGAVALDTQLYHKKILSIANGDASGLWVAKEPYPKAGAVLPFKRVIAFYGNLYSKRMGILGELPPAKMLAKLQEEVNSWKSADSTMETVPALHYIAVTAQSAAGRDGKYRLRMPFKQIDSVLAMARTVNAIVFLDIQVGLSTLEDEMKALEKYLKMPNVHLGIDPEFAMQNGHTPGQAVGVYTAADINKASDYLAKLVRENDLPPKILVVHRFTQGMVTHAKDIVKRPEVQLVMHMDGWGNRDKKLYAYNRFIKHEPVQFTGFKIFYKNDTKAPGSRVLTPAELLRLQPQPLYIQYQ